MSRYIAIEGGDGSGKSTVATAVARTLESRGHTTLVVREPGGTVLGEEIRKLLLHGPDMAPWAEAMLFGAQRAQLVAEVVAPALEKGAWVISDRTYYSSLAYQGAGRGLGLDRVREVNEIGLGGVVPDLVFILDVEVDIALQRQHRPDRIGSEKSSFHGDVHTAYRKLAADEPDRVFLIDNSLDLDSVVAQIMEHIRE
ncbi:MAG TPA: dTMP kinase [Acidimicrobiia bacterium]